MIRREFLQSTLLGALTMGAAAKVGAQATAGTEPGVYSGLNPGAPRPNLLLILTDDQGYGDVSMYGEKDLHTPNIDRIAAEGMLFTRMRANCTVCSPTRAAMLTGKYADRVGVPGVIRTHPENSWGYFDPNT